METESQARGTQLEGTVLLPDGRQLPITVNVDWSKLERAGIAHPDSLLLRAVEVFGKAEKAHSWLDTVNSQFNGLTPRAAAQTKEGKEQVLGILFDLEHGFPA
jgi:uncharacterized protein (DUF2384 family)